MNNPLNLLTIPVQAQEAEPAVKNADTISKEIFNSVSKSLTDIAENLGTIVIPAIGAIAIVVLIAQIIMAALSGHQERVANKIMWIVGVIVTVGVASIISGNLNTIF